MGGDADSGAAAGEGGGVEVEGFEGVDGRHCLPLGCLCGLVMIMLSSSSLRGDKSCEVISTSDLGSEIEVKQDDLRRIAAKEDEIR